MLLRCLSVLALLTLAAPAQADEGKKYALLVGVKEYEHSGLADLEYTENDVTELAKVLRPAGYQVALLTDSEGKKDKARKPTAQNIRAALKKVLGGKKKGDTVLVALSGHGLLLQVKGKDESFFCPSDARVNDHVTLVSLHGLFKDLGGCGAGLKLLLVEASRKKPKGAGNLGSDSLPPVSKGMAALFSCSAGEVSHGAAKHSVFFNCVLEGLRGKAKNRKGEVTWGGLADYVNDRVRVEVKALHPGASQTPHEARNLVGASPVLLRLTKRKE